MRQPTLLELVRAQAAAQQRGNLARVRKLDKIIKRMVALASSLTQGHLRVALFFYHGSAFFCLHRLKVHLW